MITHNKKVDVAVYQKGKEGTKYCGDRFFYEETDTGFICALADGLGSGEFAEESSQIVIDIIKEFPFASNDEIVSKCASKLSGKRGVVLGILKMNFKAGTYSFSSIGNIGVVTVTSEKKKKRNIPNSGYLAGFKRAFKVVEGKLEQGMNFFMFSDGVKDKELSRSMLHKDVDEVIKTFQCISGDTERTDDTTLIAMGYRG